MVRVKKECVLVCFPSCGLFQKREVASVSYVLRVRFAATERSAKTAHRVRNARDAAGEVRRNVREVRPSLIGPQGRSVSV